MLSAVLERSASLDTGVATSFGTTAEELAKWLPFSPESRREFVRYHARPASYEGILYWSAWNRPQWFVDRSVPTADRAAVVAALSSGTSVVFWMGFARCRICDKLLGTSDMVAHGMRYP